MKNQTLRDPGTALANGEGGTPRVGDSGTTINFSLTTRSTAVHWTQYTKFGTHRSMHTEAAEGSWPQQNQTERAREGWEEPGARLGEWFELRHEDVRELGEEAFEGENGCV